MHMWALQRTPWQILPACGRCLLPTLCRILLAPCVVYACAHGLAWVCASWCVHVWAGAHAHACALLVSGQVRCVFAMTLFWLRTAGVHMWRLACRGFGPHTPFIQVK